MSSIDGYRSPVFVQFWTSFWSGQWLFCHRCKCSVRVLTRLNLVLHGTNGAGQALTFSRSSVRFGAVKKNWGRQMRQTCQRLKKVNMPYHDWSLWCLEVDSLHTDTCWHAFDAHIVAVRQLNQLICSCLPVSTYNVAVFSCSFSSIRP